MKKNIVVWIILLTACDSGDNVKLSISVDSPLDPVQIIDAPIAVPDAVVLPPDAPTASIDASSTEPSCVANVDFANLQGLVTITTIVNCSGIDTVSTIDSMVVGRATVLTITHSGIICGQITKDVIDVSTIAPKGFALGVNYLFDHTPGTQDCDVIAD